MPDLRRSLLPLEAGLEPGSWSDWDWDKWGEDRRADKEREEGIMEEREDLLEVMLGSMTFDVLSVSVRPGSSPGRRAAAMQMQSRRSATA